MTVMDALAVLERYHESGRQAAAEPLSAEEELALAIVIAHMTYVVRVSVEHMRLAISQMLRVLTNAGQTAMETLDSHQG